MGDGESMNCLYTSKMAPVFQIVLDEAARADDGTTGQKEVQGFGGRFRERRPFKWSWGNFCRWNDDQLLWLGGLKAPELVECALKGRGDPCGRRCSACASWRDSREGLRSRDNLFGRARVSVGSCFNWREGQRDQRLLGVQSVSDYCTCQLERARHHISLASQLANLARRGGVLLSLR